MDAFRTSVKLALSRQRERLARLEMAVDCNQPIGAGQRAIECAKFGAFLQECAVVGNYAGLELQAAAYEYLDISGEPFNLIEDLRAVAADHGVDSHSTLRERYRKAWEGDGE